MSARSFLRTRRRLFGYKRAVFVRSIIDGNFERGGRRFAFMLVKQPSARTTFVMSARSFLRTRRWLFGYKRAVFVRRGNNYAFGGNFVFARLVRKQFSAFRAPEMRDIAVLEAARRFCSDHFEIMNVRVPYVAIDTERKRISGHAGHFDPNPARYIEAFVKSDRAVVARRGRTVRGNLEIPHSAARSDIRRKPRVGVDEIANESAFK